MSASCASSLSSDFCCRRSSCCVNAMHRSISWIKCIRRESRTNVASASVLEEICCGMSTFGAEADSDELESSSSNSPPTTLDLGMFSVSVVFLSVVFLFVVFFSCCLVVTRTRFVLRELLLRDRPPIVDEADRLAELLVDGRSVNDNPPPKESLRNICVSCGVSDALNFDDVPSL